MEYGISKIEKPKNEKSKFGIPYLPKRRIEKWKVKNCQTELEKTLY